MGSVEKLFRLCDRQEVPGREDHPTPLRSPDGPSRVPTVTGTFLRGGYVGPPSPRRRRRRVCVKSLDPTEPRRRGPPRMGAPSVPQSCGRPESPRGDRGPPSRVRRSVLVPKDETTLLTFRLKTERTSKVHDLFPPRVTRYSPSRLHFLFVRDTKNPDFSLTVPGLVQTSFSGFVLHSVFVRPRVHPESLLRESGLSSWDVPVPSPFSSRVLGVVPTSGLPLGRSLRTGCDPER